jgi:hypothetical protein
MDRAILGVNAINPLVAIYDIRGRKRVVLLLFCPGHYTRLCSNGSYLKLIDKYLISIFIQFHVVIENMFIPRTIIVLIT